MSIRTLWMDSDGAGALEYFSRDFRDLITVFRDPGVIDMGGLNVIQRIAGANMSVTITGPGRAIIDSTYTTDMGRYLATITADESDIVIGAAPGAGTRRDIVGLQVQDDAAGGPTDIRECVPVVVVGDTSGSDPALPASFLPLARVRIPSGTVSITNSLIDDLRVVSGRGDSPGTLVDVAHSLTVSGWLDCDGSAVSRTTYAALYATIGTTYGVGDGSTTFNLPDHRGRIPVALASGATGATRVVTGALGASGGAKDAITVAHVHPMPHTHTIAHTHQIDPPSTPVTPDLSLFTAEPSGSPFSVTVSGAGSGSGVTNLDVDIAAFTSGGSSAANSGSESTPNTTSTGSSGTDANVPPFATVRRLIRT